MVAVRFFFLLFFQWLAKGIFPFCLLRVFGKTRPSAGVCLGGASFFLSRRPDRACVSEVLHFGFLFHVGQTVEFGIRPLCFEMEEATTIQLGPA